MARILFILVIVCTGGLAHSQVESRPLGAPSAERAPLGAPGAQPGTLGSTLASLAAVVALMVVCYTGYRYLASRAGGLAGQVAGTGSPAGVLDLLGRYPLGRGQTLLLLKVDRRILLVAQSAGTRVAAPPAMSTLCEITDPDEVSSLLARVKQPETPFSDVIATLQRPTSPAQTECVEIVDLTRSESPMARFAGLARKRA